MHGMTKIEIQPKDEIRHGEKSIVVDRTFRSGRTERWIFEAWDTIGTNGLDIRSPRPHHFPIYLWEEVESCRRMHTVRHPAGPGLQWIKTREGYYRLLSASADPANY